MNFSGQQPYYSYTIEGADTGVNRNIYKKKQKRRKNLKKLREKF
jgi:hypothetical protein